MPAVKKAVSASARTQKTAVQKKPNGSGAALIDRVTLAVERELIQIETLVGDDVSPSQRTEAEKRARTLASLAKTLGDLMRLRAEEQKVKPDDDDVPRDLDEFRRELSQRLEQMVRGREAVSADGNE